MNIYISINKSRYVSDIKFSKCHSLHTVHMRKESLNELISKRWHIVSVVDVAFDL